VLLTFSILERGDGLTGQIIYEGKRDILLGVSGTIEGAEIRTTVPLSVWATIGEIAAILIVMVVTLIAIVTLPSFVLPQVWGRLRMQERLARHPRVKTGLIVTVLMGLAGLVVLMLVGLVVGVHQQEAANVVNFVPVKLVR